MTNTKTDKTNISRREILFHHEDAAEFYGDKKKDRSLKDSNLSVLQNCFKRKPLK